MKFNVIVCVDRMNGFSRFGRIPWFIPEELAYFKKITSTQEKEEHRKNALIMGRNTALDIGKPLPDRYNLVITNSEEHINKLTKLGFECFSSLDSALHHTDILEEDDKLEKVFICGGKGIYDEAMKKFRQIDTLYLNVINKDFKCDLFFPKVNKKIFDRIRTENITVKEIKECEYLPLSIFEYKPYNKEEQTYLDVMSEILKEGELRDTRNGKTYSMFGKSIEFDLENGFPLLTTKKMFLRGIFEELKFFLQGKTDAKILQEKGVKIWDGNTSREFLDKTGLTHYEPGDMGPMYGFQWRHFGAPYTGCKTDYKESGLGCDQFKEVIELLIDDPHSRRILMTTYNPAQSKQGVLYPCHGLVVQFYVEKDNRLSCCMYQRSADWFLGVPFNIASYALLIHIICNLLPRYKPGRLVMNFGDVHLYSIHREQAETQMSRVPYMFPILNIKKVLTEINDIDSLEFGDLEIKDYECYSAIKADMVA